MSQYGKKVVAVIDTQSTFGVTIKSLKETVDTLQSNFNLLTNLAPGTLDTLQEIGAAITDLTTRTSTLEASPPIDISGKANRSGDTFTGNVVVERDYPDVELKSNGEKRFIFTDAGGGATGAIKNTNSNVDIYAGGVLGSHKELSVTSTGVDVVARLTAGVFNIPTSVPASPTDGDIYFDKTALALKIYVDDGSSQQWVQL